MVEFTLPKNSRISNDGKTWPAPAGASKTREYRIYLSLIHI